MTDLGLRLRDHFFALAREPDPVAHRRLLAEVDALTAAPLTDLYGLSLSPFPTARFKQLRFIDADRLPARVRDAFARPCPELPGLAAAFVAPEELAYHNFENIVGLDRLFTGVAAAPLRFTQFHKLAPGITTARLDPSPALADRLAQLATLGLFVPPQDASRGGQRFIFHSAELAAALTAAVQADLPAKLLRGFVHVNPVFRCNRFDPGDAPFTSHVDSPYRHRARHHVSKYTLLLYLTPGRGEPLRFARGPVLREISAYTAVIFPQSARHSGSPYLEGRKLFLRTELIFADPRLAEAPAVGELFARACYLGSESIFSPELAARAHAAYDAAAAAHWRGPPDQPTSETYFHKQFRGAHFVTDGHDYWFNSKTITRTDAAALALLDQLNARVTGEPFREACTTEIHQAPGRAWIPALLRAQLHAPPPESVFARLNRHALLPEPEEPDDNMDFPSSPDFHGTFPDDWDAARNPRVLAVYTRARRWALRRIFDAPICVLGKQLFLEPDRFLVDGDKIHILSRDSLGPLHFAGAVFFDPEDFVGVELTLHALQPIVPPMTFHDDGDTLHLCCDLFRNTWMVSQRTDIVPVPRVLPGTDVDPKEGPWHHATGLTREQLTAAEPDES